MGWIDYLGPGENIAMAEPVVADIIKLKVGGSRQHNIGETSSRCHEYIGEGNKIELQ